MKEINLDKYRYAWKNEDSFSKDSLSKEDIHNYLGTKSKDITNLFRTGLTIDIVLKSLVAASLLVLFVLFPVSTATSLIIITVLLLTFGGIIYQARVFRAIPHYGYQNKDFRKALEEKVNFYNRKYIKSIYTGALSNCLIFISGMLYYFHLKYGEIRSFETDDYLVFSGAVIIAFVFGALIQLYQHNFHIRQLTECLREIDEETISKQSLRNQCMRRRRIFFIALIAVIFGILLLAYIIAR